MPRKRSKSITRASFLPDGIHRAAHEATLKSDLRRATDRANKVEPAIPVVPPPPFAIVEISGGVGEATVERGCSVILIDWDNAKGGDLIEVPQEIMQRLPSTLRNHILRQNAATTAAQAKG